MWGIEKFLGPCVGRVGGGASSSPTLTTSRGVPPSTSRPPFSLKPQGESNPSGKQKKNKKKEKKKGASTVNLGQQEIKSLENFVGTRNSREGMLLLEKRLEKLFYFFFMLNRCIFGCQKVQLTSGNKVNRLNVPVMVGKVAQVEERFAWIGGGGASFWLWHFLHSTKKKKKGFQLPDQHTGWEFLVCHIDSA